MEHVAQRVMIQLTIVTSKKIMVKFQLHVPKNLGCTYLLDCELSHPKWDNSQRIINTVPAIDIDTII